MEEGAYRLYVGVDWGSRRHQVAIVEPGGRRVAEHSVEHSGDGLSQMVACLEAAAGGEPCNRIAVAIEVPRGAIVDTLLERGFHVYAINPKQLDRFRDRHCVSGAKDDRLDAFVLADSLRTDAPKFKRLQAEDPSIIELRSLVSIDAELSQQIVRLMNRLREQLWRYFPQVLKVAAADLDRLWVWKMLELVPTPEHAQRVRARSLAKVLKEHRIRKHSARELLQELRKEPLRLVPGAAEAASSHVAFLLPQLKLHAKQRRQCQDRIASIIKQLQDTAPDVPEAEKGEHRDVEILLSVPGIGKLVAATMLAEASQPLAQRDYHVLRAQAGVAPITRQSGKHRTVSMRRACKGRLRYAVFHWARVNIQRDARSRAHYDQLRARGASHGRALRQVGDGLLKMLTVMLQTRTLYDPERRLTKEAA